MPSPYAHAIAGVMLAAPYLKSKPAAIRHREEIATIMAFSLVADLDAIPGFLTRNLSAYHNQISHSILVALVASLAYATIRRLLPNPKPFWRIFSLAALAYGVHILMDCFTHGRGVMLVWPISSQRYAPPGLLFYGLRYSKGWFSHHHLITFITESLTMLPVLALVWLLLKKKGLRAHEK